MTSNPVRMSQTSVPVFDGEEYEHWSLMMKRSNGLWGLVDQSFSEEAEEGEEASSIEEPLTIFILCSLFSEEEEEEAGKEETQEGEEASSIEEPLTIFILCSLFSAAEVEEAETEEKEGEEEKEEETEEETEEKEEEGGGGGSRFIGEHHHQRRRRRWIVGMASAMPKKMGVNSKAEVARKRKSATKTESKAPLTSQKEEKYWCDTEKSKSRAAKHLEDEAKKRADAAASKAENRKLADLEKQELEHFEKNRITCMVASLKKLTRKSRKRNRVGWRMRMSMKGWCW